MDIDLAVFHQALLGRDPEVTPGALWVTDLHRRLYGAFPAVRGLSKAEQDERALLGALVTCLAQTSPEGGREVFLFTPRHHREWVAEGVDQIVRYAVRCRRKDAAGLRRLRTMAKQLTIHWQALQVEQAPPFWAAVGFAREMPLPDWLRAALLR